MKAGQTMAKFKVGDIVQLKSGGPKMTCTETNPPDHEGDIECKWFAGAKQQVDYFPPDALMFPEEESSPLHEIVEAIEREERRSSPTRPQRFSREDPQMDWEQKEIAYHGFAIWVGRGREGDWIASVNALPEQGAMGTAGPGEGKAVSGDFDSREAVIEAAKRHIDEIHRGRHRPS